MAQVFIQITLRRVLALALALSPGLVARADHPNQGTATLSALIDKALGANQEIREAEANLRAAESLRRGIRAPFLPELSLEGGQQEVRWDEQRATGTFAYGLAHWNLYRGGRDQVRIEQQQIEQEFSRTTVERTKARVEREVARLYFQLLYFQEAIAVKAEALETNQRQLLQAQKRQSAGITSQADVLEFELREATLKSDLNLLSQEETAKERELRLLLNQTSDEPIRVGGHLHREKLRASSAELLSLGTQNQEDLQLANKELQTSQLEKRFLVGEYLPQVNFEGKFGRLNSEEAVSEANDDYSLMLKVSVPLFSGFSTFQNSKAQQEVVVREQTKVERLKLDLRTKIDGMVARLRSIEQRLDLEERNVERSKLYYNITVGEYKRGVKNSPDVAGAAERLYDSRLRNLEYRKDFYLTCIDLAETVGTNGTGIFR